MKGACGIRTLAYVTGQDFDDVRWYLAKRFGKTHILGPDMRQLLTGWGWTWTNSRGASRSQLPQQGTIVVTTRRGFYAMTDGQPHQGFEAPICGYYTPPRTLVCGCDYHVDSLV